MSNETLIDSFGYVEAGVQRGHLLIDDVIWGQGTGDVISVVTVVSVDADLLVGDGRQLGRRLDRHLAGESDVSRDVIAELLDARQPLADQFHVGGRDVTLQQGLLQAFT